MPTGPEQLRHRLTVMFNALAMIKLRRTNRVEISDVASDVFDKYKDYLLGDYVYGLRSGEGQGGSIPPWILVLSYDQAIRKMAYKLVGQEGYKQESVEGYHGQREAFHYASSAIFQAPARALAALARQGQRQR